MAEENGVWRTVRGRRVFIRDGEDLESAMKRSGKFKIKMNEMAVKGAKEKDLKEQYMESLNNVSEMEYNGEITKDEYDQSIKNINEEYKNRKKGIINGRETKAKEIDKFNNDINPMEEWSDTVGDGYSDAQRKEIERFKERKGTKQEVSTREIPESVVKRLNQKGLKEMANNGATDITRYSESDLKKLEKKHGRLEVVKRTMGTYGMNGGLFRSNKTGEYFVVTSRNGNLFYLA